MVCEVQPEISASLETGGRIDEEVLSWKPYTAEQWAVLAMRAEDAFWSALALCNVLLARAEARRATRLQIAIAYQLPMPAREAEDDLVSASRAGYEESVPCIGPGEKDADLGNAPGAQEDSPDLAEDS